MAEKFTLDLYQGTDSELKFRWRDINGVYINFTGYSATFTMADGTGNVVLSLSTPMGIVLSGIDGTIKFTAAQTAALPVGQYVAKLNMISSSSITRLLYGIICVRS